MLARVTWRQAGRAGWQSCSRSSRLRGVQTRLRTGSGAPLGFSV